MKRKLKWLAIVLAVSLLGFGTALLLWPRDRITVESWQKIRIGMTEDEVAEILGRPGMSHEEYLDEINRPEKEVDQMFFEIEDPRPAGGVRLVVWDRARIWTGRRGIIEIELDQDNKVCWMRFKGLRWKNADVIDRLRDWLDW